MVGGPWESTGARVYLDRELPPGGAREYTAARKRGVRSFTMWTDPHRLKTWARVVTAPDDEKAPSRYEVYDGSDRFVGSVTRERSFTHGHLRTRWTAQQEGRAAAVGYKGRLAWWAVWWLIFPVQCVLAPAMLFSDGDIFRAPRRIGYRHGGTRVLDYGSGMQNHFHLTAVHAPDWNPQMLAALLALHTSHDGIMGDSWDKGADETANPAVPRSG
ncbi:hypothetical protein AN218_14725 [Streptomyces nanshensis]|uniref:Uncharacterized protein n=1 Tax=Streptomyces nanshensis TaxID=518642 RepID=A0A1E7L4C0_9ACTN|nr:hypothetical protein AN218_14725 [Streptomyces nanshensis]